MLLPAKDRYQMPAKGKGHEPYWQPLMQVGLLIANDLDRGLTCCGETLELKPYAEPSELENDTYPE